MRTDSTVEQAKARHLAGDFAGARALYEAALAAEPGHADAMFRLGVLALQCGTPDEALAWLDRALAIEPQTSRYHFARGQVLAALGRFAAAIDVYRNLLAFDATSADLWFALGGALQASGDLQAAAAAYESTVALDPQHADALNDLGNCRRQLGAPERAEAAYRRALALQPQHGQALTNLGTLLQARGRLDDAVDMLLQAAQAAPDSPACLVNLGVALCAQHRYADAAALLARAADLAPHDAAVAYNLGNAHYGLGRLRDAQAQYRRALRLDPRHADAHNNLGNVCKALGEFEAAAAAFDAALTVRPGFVAAYNNLGNLLRTLGRTSDAEACLRAALRADPQHAATHSNLGNVLKDSGALDEGIAHYRRAITCDPQNAVAHSNLAYALTFQTEQAADVLAECRRWAARHETPLAAQRAPHANPRIAGRRLRIGYVGADFRDHCQALFTVPLLAHHDHAQFEIHGYASVERPDAMTQRIAGYADVWHPVHALDDAQLAQQIRADGIDILVDLTMHMAGGRPALFARKPAPVQIAWLAYPGTTGLDAIDYRLTDPRLDPPGTDDAYSERSLRLPDTFWCYDPLASEPSPNALPALHNGYVTFGCLNNPCKLTDRTLALWRPVLDAVDGARLLLMAPEGDARQRLAGRFARHGIDPRRVDYQPFLPRAAYLRTYHAIDIGLDTFPYNGHTTSLDAFWMGVPVVTRSGATAVGRGGLSQLFNLGLSALAAGSDEDFARIAATLAADLPRVAGLRADLRTRMQRSPLMDGARFAANVEAAYRQVWRDWCAR
jgi:protein O-GlcNAc transferase